MSGNGWFCACPVLARNQSAIHLRPKYLQTLEREATPKTADGQGFLAVAAGRRALDS